MKWIGRIFILLIITPIILGVYAYFELQTHKPPNIDKAEYAVQGYYELKDGKRIPTRYYYTEKIDIIGGKAILNNYWLFDGNKYKFVKGEKAVNPPFDIVRRIE